MEYTPGNWTVLEIMRPHSITIRSNSDFGSPNSHIIATVNNKVDAQLMASAPDLYEANKWAIEELERLAPVYGDTAYSIITILNGAKLKAEGK